MLQTKRKRVREMAEGKRGVATAPTMRLITLPNCVPCGARYGIEPLAVSDPMASPIEHAIYELNELPSPPAENPRSMPWEEDDDTFKRFRETLPATLSTDVFYAQVALPTLSSDANAPQRSDEWHKARSFAITASQFASAAHENPGMSAEKLLASKTFPRRNGFQGNSFTEWGNLHEKHAEEAFVQFLCERKNVTSIREINASGVCTHWTFSDGSTLEHPQHIRHPDTQWLGFSPDALLWEADRKEVALIEYKCPAYQRNGPGHPYAAKNSLCLPRQYMPQLQGSLLLLRAQFPGVLCERAWFVVWQAHQFFVTHVPYVPAYATRTVNASSTFFRDRFLPACVAAIEERDEKMKVVKVVEK